MSCDRIVLVVDLGNDHPDHVGPAMALVGVPVHLADAEKLRRMDYSTWRGFYRMQSRSLVGLGTCSRDAAEFKVDAVDAVTTIDGIVVMCADGYDSSETATSESERSSEITSSEESE